MNTATMDLPSSVGLPGTTASGLASASQLVEFTPSTPLRGDMTASPRELVVLEPLPAYEEAVRSSPCIPLAAADYPVLARIWDNEEDDIFDTV